MKYLALPNKRQHILPFYLAMEEYATRLCGSDGLFFMWQVEPTVIFGRNQLIDNEVNVDYCRENKIAMYRRRSGGGCVFADQNNIMFSYITRSDNVETTFRRYTTLVVEMLKAIGLDASDNSRNDVLIAGRKVSGNAFYHTNGHSIVHGTMLYDTDMKHITRAITPSGAKMASKAVKSVRSRITTIREHSTISLEDFKEHAKIFMTDGEIMLDNDDVKEINELTKPYLEQDFIYGKNPRYNTTITKRVEGVGDFIVNIEINHNTIKNLNISGDFLLVGDVDEMLISRLRGVKFTAESIRNALCDINTADVIMNLRKEDFVELLTANNYL